MSDPRPSTPSYPLRSLLLLLMVALAVPTLLVSALAIRNAATTNRETIERRLLEEARTLRRNVDGELQESIRALQAMAGSPTLARGDVEGFKDEAERHLGAHPAWMSVRLAAPDGRQLIATGTGPDVAPRDEAVHPESLRRAVATRAPVLGAMRTGWREDDQYAFPVRVPVVRAGRVLYVLSAIITPEGLRRALALDTSGRDGLRAVVNTDHVVVVRTRNPEAFVGRPVSPAFLAALESADEGVVASRTLDGEDVYTAFSRSADSGWRVSVSVPRDSLERDFVGAMALLGLMGSLLLAVGVGGSYFIARWIARDISMVSEAASELAGGRPIVMGTPRVSEVRRLASALERSAALIRVREQERDERVSRADAARAEAEAATRAKDEFLAMLGHELRNPLAPVLSALHVARTTGGTLAERERAIVERQVRHMARLVDDLLDVSRLRRGAVDLHLESVDVRTLVTEAADMTRALFDEQRQTLVLDVPEGLTLYGDAHRLTQVLSNLLSNAAKYTNADGSVVISARAIGGDVVIACEDNGLGIRPDLLPRVFDPFVQGTRGIDRRQGGLGLGLAVAKSLVEQHGGTIAAYSDGEGRGSRFVVRLPANGGQALRGAEAASGVKQATSTARVLVVEDNDDVREMLTLALTLGGLDVRSESSARAALDVFAEWRPTVAVLDIGLPEIDGFALAQRLRTLDGGSDVHLIALTGYGGETYAAQARAAGFNEFFVKPVGVDALIDAIARLSSPRA
jgi:signal transduction histidine kinase/ActR/RegA family two-component response regulator